MNAVSPKHDGDVFDKGKSPENKGKNRYSNIIPGNKICYRCVQMSFSEYLNSIPLLYATHIGYICNTNKLMCQSVICKYLHLQRRNS